MNNFRKCPIREKHIQLGNRPTGKAHLTRTTNQTLKLDQN